MTDTGRSFTSMLEDAQGGYAGQTRILVMGVRCAMLEMVTMVDFASYAGEPWNLMWTWILCSLLSVLKILFIGILN